MRYIALPEALVAAERAIGLPASMAANEELRRLLDSALHSPQATWDGVDLVPTIEQKAAALCRHICLNHPFPDGNKRMAWLLTVMFLRINCHEMYEDDVRAICVMVEIASSGTSQEEIDVAFGRWIRPLDAVLV